jgi:hypothetical protein
MENNVFTINWWNNVLNLNEIKIITKKIPVEYKGKTPYGENIFLFIIPYNNENYIFRSPLEDLGDEYIGNVDSKIVHYLNDNNIPYIEKGRVLCISKAYFEIIENDNNNLDEIKLIPNRIDANVESKFKNSEGHTYFELRINGNILRAQDNGNGILYFTEFDNSIIYLDKFSEYLKQNQIPYEHDESHGFSYYIGVNSVYFNFKKDEKINEIKLVNNKIPVSYGSDVNTFLFHLKGNYFIFHRKENDELINYNGTDTNLINYLKQNNISYKIDNDEILRIPKIYFKIKLDIDEVKLIQNKIPVIKPEGYDDLFIFHLDREQYIFKKIDKHEYLSCYCPDSNYIKKRNLINYLKENNISYEIGKNSLVSIPEIYFNTKKDNINESQSNKSKNIKEYISLLGHFAKYCCKDLNIPLPSIKIINNSKYTEENKSFGGYNPNTNTIYLVIYQRTLGDSTRTLLHELYHSYQNHNDQLSQDSGEDGDEIENSANSYSGKMMRKLGRKYPQIFFMKYSS